jgi:hypothetical protein
MTTKTFEDYEYEFDGVQVSVSFDAEYEAEDDGIGSYEYWGAKCRDVYWVNRCQEVTITSVVTEDGRDILDDLDPKTVKTMENDFIETADEYPPDID